VFSDQIKYLTPQKLAINAQTFSLPKIDVFAAPGHSKLSSGLPLSPTANKHLLTERTLRIKFQQEDSPPEKTYLGAKKYYKKTPAKPRKKTSVHRHQNNQFMPEMSDL
jgi:hypothetical protein